MSYINVVDFKREKEMKRFSIKCCPMVTISIESSNSQLSIESYQTMLTIGIDILGVTKWMNSMDMDWIVNG